jgi:hypothetical protein
MNVAGDRITRFTSSHHKLNILYECLPCRFQTNSNASFLNHKITRVCSQYHGNWFIKCKKHGMKNYYHIVHSYFWNKVMNNIQKRFIELSLCIV